MMPPQSCVSTRPSQPSVKYTITGTASSGKDYKLSSGTLEFKPGEISKTIHLKVLNDRISETDETVILTLSSPTNTTLGVPTTFTLTIQDNDPALLAGLLDPLAPSL